MRATHTYALLEVPQALYDIVAEKLRAAGYDHAFIKRGDGRYDIDMHGIGIAPEGSE